MRSTEEPGWGLESGHSCNSWVWFSDRQLFTYFHLSVSDMALEGRFYTQSAFFSSFFSFFFFSPVITEWQDFLNVVLYRVKRKFIWFLGPALNCINDFWFGALTHTSAGADTNLGCTYRSRNQIRTSQYIVPLKRKQHSVQEFMKSGEKKKLFLALNHIFSAVQCIINHPSFPPWLRLLGRE